MCVFLLLFFVGRNFSVETSVRGEWESIWCWMWTWTTVDSASAATAGDEGCATVAAGGGRCRGHGCRETGNSEHLLSTQLIS